MKDVALAKDKQGIKIASSKVNEYEKEALKDFKIVMKRFLGDKSKVMKAKEDSMEDMYLTFRVNERDFGVDIKHVVEIVVLTSITEVPDLPNFVKGIINLRGKVIPLVDMRSRFHIQAIDYNEKNLRNHN